MTAEPAGTAAAPITIVRNYRADVQELWELWTTKDGFASWWGPQEFRVDVHTLEAREGGSIHYEMIADTPRMKDVMRKMGSPESHAVRGTYATFTPCTHLVLQQVIDFLPGVTTYDSIIDVTFETLGAHARMVMTLHPMHSPEFSGMQVQGFTSQLTKLDARYDSA